MPQFVHDRDQPHAGGNVKFGDHNTITPSLWRQLVERFAVRSMLDVGCGEGHAVKFFHSIGVIAHGIDALRKNVERAVHPIAYHDLTEAPYIMPVDLVLSIEVAEHIEEKFLKNYLDTLCNGNIIAFTHARPRQEGHHHVNCREEEYWVSHFANRGYRVDEYNYHWRRVVLAEREHGFFAQTGLVLIRTEQAELSDPADAHQPR